VYNALPYEQLEEAELPVKPQISFEDYPVRRSTLQRSLKKSEKPLLPKREKEQALKLK